MSEPLTPPTPDPALFPGLVGDVVSTFAPITEAAPAAIALQFLVALGNALGRGPHFYVGETRHHLNENLLVVGRSSRSRKGDSKNIALAPLEVADPDWAGQVASGLSSGEGLIFHVRDPLTKTTKKGELEIEDAGVADKRLLVVETEFSRPLKCFRREANTLSDVLRDAWDGKRTLRTLTKKSPTRATEAHISIIGQTTPEDLRAYLGDLEAANGLGNRFLFALVDRTKLVASPRRVPPAALQDLARRVHAILAFGRTIGELVRTRAADELWERLYPTLTTDRPGLLGKLLARSEAHVSRVSALYALAAQERMIDVPHLTSALAVWDYTVASAERIFQHRTGNADADRLMAEMLPGTEMALSDLRKEVFANHISAGRLRDALDLLRALGMVRLEPRETAGRSAVFAIRLDPAAHPTSNGNADPGAPAEATP